jgi:antitoxin (DNA-binding transcriptional repressor) of toxin-antitoxin stability system
MVVVSKSVLKAKMLEYFRNAERTGEGILVTDHKKPVLEITPYKQKKSIDEIFGKYRGKISYTEPLEKSTEDEWETLK